MVSLNKGDLFHGKNICMEMQIKHPCPLIVSIPFFQRNMCILIFPFHTKTYNQRSYFLYSNTSKITIFKRNSQTLVKMQGWGGTWVFQISNKFPSAFKAGLFPDHTEQQGFSIEFLNGYSRGHRSAPQLMTAVPKLLISFALGVSGWCLRQPEPGLMDSNYTELYPWTIITHTLCVFL